MEKNQLYRQKSLDRISSPEQLHDYMRVTSPRIWMLLCAILVLVAGFIVYASTANMESTMPIRVTVTSFDAPENTGKKEFAVYSALPLDQKESVSVGMKVRIGSETGKVNMLLEDAEEQRLTLMFVMDRENAVMVDGEYDAELVLESTTPISFLWN